MDEPDNLTLVLIGSLNDNDPWDLELWARDDANAKGSTAHWYRACVGEDSPNFESRSWGALREYAAERKGPLTILGTGAR